MAIHNRFAKLTQAFALFALIAAFAVAAFPSASHAAVNPPRISNSTGKVTIFGESAGGGLHSIQRGVLDVVSPIQEGANRVVKPPSIRMIANATVPR